MKIRAANQIEYLPPGPAKSLQMLRRLRGFEPASWCRAKMTAINHYLAQAHLSAAVVGVSGGLDSALVASLLVHAARLPNSPLRRVVLLALPAHGDAGVSGQSDAVIRARQLAEHLEHPLLEVDVAPAASQMRTRLANVLQTKPQAWAAGQGIAIARTLALYQATSLLAQEGLPSLVVGTTNRDEGAYLGYVGKASDGMVDLQVISELHKSEVRLAAQHMGVPSVFLDVEPTGDMFDACPDTAVFGAPYDAVELLILARTLLRPDEWETQQDSWPVKDRVLWQQAEINLEQLHGYNAHKYLVRSPAVHLDLLDSAMPGGWHPAAPQPHAPASTVLSPRPSPRLLPAGDRKAWVSRHFPDHPVADHNGLRLEIPRLLTTQGLAQINESLAHGPWTQADTHGNWRKGAQSGQVLPGPGSWRTTIEDPALAQALWETLRHYLPPFRVTHALSRFDGAPGTLWRPIGINPVFRAIAYGPGGVLVPHYDGPFVIDARRRTGMSLVIYLDQASSGGQLRFLHDAQATLPIDQCDLSDWTRAPHAHEIAQVIDTHPGTAWVFDHYQLHDSTPIIDGHKRLLRTDIIFEQVGPA